MDKLKDVYGENYFDDIESRSNEELAELAGNLRRGVPMGTPVFDGAREGDVTDMLL